MRTTPLGLTDNVCCHLYHIAFCTAVRSVLCYHYDHPAYCSSNIDRNSNSTMHHVQTLPTPSSSAAAFAAVPSATVLLPERSALHRKQLIGHPLPYRRSRSFAYLHEYPDPGSTGGSLVKRPYPARSQRQAPPRNTAAKT